MSGANSDLRLGLPAQTVLDGSMPYHEPMRLLTIIEAPRTRVESVIATHPGLERLFHNEWVLLVVCEASEGAFYHYDIMRGWQPVSGLPEQSSAAAPRFVRESAPFLHQKDGETVGSVQEATAFEQKRMNP